MALTNYCWFSTISMYCFQYLQFFFFNPIIDQKLFSANLRASFSQKVKGSKRNYAWVTFASEVLQVLFAVDNFVLYILIFSYKENTPKETFNKVKLKAPWWGAIFILPTIIPYRGSFANWMLCYIEKFLWFPY